MPFGLIKKLKTYGIACNKYFPPIHLFPFYMKMFGYKKGDFPVTEHVADRTIAIPFFTEIKQKQVDYVCDRLIKILKEF